MWCLGVLVRLGEGRVLLREGRQSLFLSYAIIAYMFEV